MREGVWRSEGVWMRGARKREGKKLKGGEERMKRLEHQEQESDVRW